MSAYEPNHLTAISTIVPVNKESYLHNVTCESLTTQDEKFYGLMSDDQFASVFQELLRASNKDDLLKAAERLKNEAYEAVYSSHEEDFNENV